MYVVSLSKMLRDTESIMLNSLCMNKISSPMKRDTHSGLFGDIDKKKCSDPLGYGLYWLIFAFSLEYILKLSIQR